MSNYVIVTTDKIMLFLKTNIIMCVNDVRQLHIYQLICTLLDQ